MKKNEKARYSFSYSNDKFFLAMINSKSLITTAIAFALFCHGCAISKLNQDIDQQKRSIQSKENIIKDEDSKQIYLQQSIDNKKTEIKNQEYTTKEIKLKLEKLRHQNAEAKMETESQIKTKLEIDKVLKDQQSEIETLEHRTNLSIEEKQNNLKNINEKIEKYLILMEKL